MKLPEKRYLRRGEVMSYLGVSESEMKKIVAARVFTPLYFGGGGRAFYKREEVLTAESSGKLFSPVRLSA